MQFVRSAFAALVGSIALTQVATASDAREQVPSFVQSQILGKTICSGKIQENWQDDRGAVRQVWDRKAQFSKLERTASGIVLSYDVKVDFDDYLTPRGEASETFLGHRVAESQLVFELRWDELLGRYVGLTHYAYSRTANGGANDVTAQGHLVKDVRFDGTTLELVYEDVVPRTVKLENRTTLLRYTYDEKLSLQDSKLVRDWRYQQVEVDPASLANLGALDLGAQPSLDREANCAL